MSISASLPPIFLDRLRQLLGPEFGAFRASFEEPARHGLRINTLKWPTDEAVAGLPWALERLPWCPTGFRIDPGSRAGKHPFHAAGLYYLQEPSTMAAAELLDIQPGHSVIDVSASPGGKSTHLASLLGQSGLLVANDPVRGRIKALGENLERWGAQNVVIANAAVSDLADSMPGVFDRVLVDAPCSGEGMFRKSPVAVREWSEDHVRGCAIRQEQLLRSAARLVRPGGLLLYCTCTFAPEEDERQIAQFLDHHPDWIVREITLESGSRGRRDWVDGQNATAVSQTVRIWPHLAAGEGHYFALLQAPGRDAQETDDRVFGAGRQDGPVWAEARAAWESFRSDVLPGFHPIGDLVQRGEHLFMAPEHFARPVNIPIVRPGLPLGQVRPGRFEPSHALAMAAAADDFAMTHALNDDETRRYLAGEVIRADGPVGWVGMTINGFPLGWGKRSGNVIKNHYPRGLRT